MASLSTRANESHDPASIPSSRPESTREPSLRSQHETTRTSTQQQSVTSRSRMFRRTATSDSDEILPIRHSAADIARNYNTTEQTPVSSSQTNTTPEAGQAATAAEANGAGHGHKKENRLRGWAKGVFEKYGSISLENKGSVARDHLALERTFLAWLRTSLAFASIGIAITQLFRLNTSLSSRARMMEVALSTSATSVPFSPLLGHSIPADIAPYLQSIFANQGPTPTPSLGPTLLDQLFLLSADGKPIIPPQIAELKDDVHIATSDTKIRHLGKPLGATFIGISILVLIVGFHRYFEAQYWIIRGKFPASRGSVALVALITAALIVSSLVVIVVVGPTTYERKK